MSTEFVRNRDENEEEALASMEPTEQSFDRIQRVNHSIRSDRNQDEIFLRIRSNLLSLIDKEKLCSRSTAILTNNFSVPN